VRLKAPLGFLGAGGQPVITPELCSGRRKCSARHAILVVIRASRPIAFDEFLAKLAVIFETDIFSSKGNELEAVLI